MNDIQSANQLKQSIQIQYDDIKQEREQLTRLAQDLQIASDNLSQREIDVSLSRGIVEYVILLFGYFTISYFVYEYLMCCIHMALTLYRWKL